MPEPKPPQQPKTPEQSIEAIVWAEVNAQKRPSHKSEEQWTPAARATYYMNNFYTRIPSTVGRDAREHYVKTGKRTKTLEDLEKERGKKWKEWYSKPDEDPGKRRQERGFSLQR